MRTVELKWQETESMWRIGKDMVFGWRIKRENWHWIEIKAAIRIVESKDYIQGFQW